MKVDLKNIQSSVYKPSGMVFGNCLLFQFKQGDPSLARHFLKDIGSLVTTADMTELDRVLNVGITYEGLQALGLPSMVLESLPVEYTNPRSSDIRGRE